MRSRSRPGGQFGCGPCHPDIVAPARDGRNAIPGGGGRRRPRRDGPPEHRNRRWAYLHMIEEYARHNGHADLLRERIDGVTGD